MIVPFLFFGTNLTSATWAKKNGMDMFVFKQIK